MFGKRNRPARPENPEKSIRGSDSGAGGPPPTAGKFPWDHDAESYVACNLASGNLANNLASWVAHEGRLHAETYVAVSGAIAGYAAQQTLLARYPSALPPGMHVITTTSGDKYLSGGPLNALLITNSEAEASGRVWSRAAGAALSAGLPLSGLPHVEAMFGHVASNLGGPMEGLPSTGPKHQPVAPARKLLSLFWPQVMRLFKADFDETHRRFGPVPPKWWGPIAAFAASRPVHDVKHVLEPAIAITILMESAICASKLTRL